MSLTITSLFCYPIKSCAGTAAQEVPVDAQGVRFDRQWVVTDADGIFITQRSHPKLTCLYPSIEGANMVVRASGAPDLTVPLKVDRRERHARTVTVQKFTGTAEDEGEEAAAWFSARLGGEYRLFHTGAAWNRSMDPHYTRPADRVGFADDYPILLTTEASLADLNGRLREAVPMSRFRPNVVVTGENLAAWAEDDWRCLRVRGGGTLRVVRTCARCGMITIDQATAERRGPEPLQTLSGFRRTEENRVLFGVYLIADAPQSLRIGDRISAE